MDFLRKSLLFFFRCSVFTENTQGELTFSGLQSLSLLQVEGSGMAGRESVGYDYLAPQRGQDEAGADIVTSEDAEGETLRCAGLGVRDHRQQWDKV